MSDYNVKYIDLETLRDVLIVRVTRSGKQISSHTLHAPCPDDGSLAHLKGMPGGSTDLPPNDCKPRKAQ